MRKSADVLELKENNLAKVMLYKHAKCHGCGSCNKHLHPGSIFEIKNTINARVGDMIDVDVKKSFSLVELLVSYILPPAFFFIGLLIGIAVFEGKNAGMFTVISAFLFLVIAIVINVIYKKRYKPRYSVSMVKRIVPAEPRLK